jgi:hypothetical protein
LLEVHADAPPVGCVAVNNPPSNAIHNETDGHVTPVKDEPPCVNMGTDLQTDAAPRGFPDAMMSAA